jgi:hypothetical protein
MGVMVKLMLAHVTAVAAGYLLALYQKLFFGTPPRFRNSHFYTSSSSEKTLAMRKVRCPSAHFERLAKLTCIPIDVLTKAPKQLKIAPSTADMLDFRKFSKRGVSLFFLNDI